MNMIEKVARALCAHNYNNLNEDVIERIVETCWKAYISSAAVAIKAMKEPTEEMILACLHLYFQDEKEGNNTKEKFNGRNLWNKMIEAALKE